MMDSNSKVLMESIDALIDKRIISRILPNSGPEQIEFQILKLYFLISFSALIIIASINLLKTIQELISHPKPTRSLELNRSRRESNDQKHEWDGKDSQHIIDLYLDLNHYHLTQTQTAEFDLDSNLNELRRLVEQILREKCGLKIGEGAKDDHQIKLNYWCYIDLEQQDSHQSSLSSSSSIILEQIKLLSLSNRETVQIIDTSSLQTPSLSEPSKPLLSDLLAIANGTIGQRLYLVSTSDMDLFEYGIRLLKDHPYSPLVCFVKPFGCSNLPIRSGSADFVLEWEDQRLKWDKTDSKNVHSGIEECQMNNEFFELMGRQDERFKPLMMILRAYGEIGIGKLRLKNLVQNLRAWKFDHCHGSLSDEDQQNEQIMEFVRCALKNQIICVYPDTLDLDHRLGDLEDSVMVSLDRRLFLQVVKSSHTNKKQELERIDSQSNLKVTIEDDRLTTTCSSDSDEKSSVGRKLERGDSESLIVSNRMGIKRSMLEAQLSKTETIECFEPRYQRFKDRSEDHHLMSEVERPNKKKKQQQQQMSDIEKKQARRLYNNLKAQIRKRGRVQSSELLTNDRIRFNESQEEKVKSINQIKSNQNLSKKNKKQVKKNKRGLFKKIEGDHQDQHHYQYQSGISLLIRNLSGMIKGGPITKNLEMIYGNQENDNVFMIYDDEERIIKLEIFNNVQFDLDQFKHKFFLNRGFYNLDFKFDDDLIVLDRSKNDVD